MGPPRSGTTFVAQTCAEVLGVNLLPEAQWILNRYRGDLSDNDYTLANWGEVHCSVTEPGGTEIEACMVEYLGKRTNDSQSVFVEHTPQNALILRKLSRNCADALFLFVLRDPRKSIVSLVSQDWFAGGILSAAILNFRILLRALAPAILKAPYFHLINLDTVDEKSIRMLLENYGVPKNGLSQTRNYYLDDLQVKCSHAYLNGEKRSQRQVSRQFGAGILARIAFMPSLLVYWFLMRLVHD
jgi:hypothetical protein